MTLPVELKVELEAEKMLVVLLVVGICETAAVLVVTITGLPEALVEALTDGEVGGENVLVVTATVLLVDVDIGMVAASLVVELGSLSPEKVTSLTVPSHPYGDLRRIMPQAPASPHRKPHPSELPRTVK
ncbi:hypothetical protein HDU96_007433 [Phlyctochytrium bullatum]|nr:hypothetical protein HDU96_007433 [Phlyctochytrium bullatum]